MSENKESRQFCMRIATLFLVLFASFIVYNEYRVKLVETVSYGLVVGHGINSSTIKSDMNFGNLERGSISSRTITIEPASDYIVHIVNDGPDFVYMSERKFFVNKGAVKQIKMYAQIPDDLEDGKYSGQLRVIFRR